MKHNRKESNLEGKTGETSTKVPGDNHRPFLRSHASSTGKSDVASADSGRFSMQGNGNLPMVMKVDKCGGSFGRRSIFLGVEMKEIL